MIFASGIYNSNIYTSGIYPQMDVASRLDSVPSSATYNSFATRDEIDTIINQNDPFIDVTAWNALTIPQQENVILRVTDNANSFQYLGVTSKIVISPENMMFPRDGIQYANGVAIPSTENPLFIKEYIAQRCTEILGFGPASGNALTVPNNVKKQKVGDLEQEFFGPDVMTANTLSLTDFSSFGYIKPYVVKNANLINWQRA